MKVDALPAEVKSMLLVQTLFTIAYLVLVGRVWAVGRSGGSLFLPTRLLPSLPVADLAPESAVGWPPQDDGFDPYVDEGIAALDAYLSEGFAP